MAITAKPHGHFLAGEAGELAGVSGTTIGQWARWGYIRASQSGGDPHVYSVEDVRVREHGLHQRLPHPAPARLGHHEDVAEVAERDAVADHARVADLAALLVIGAEAQRRVDDAVVLLARAPARPVAVLAQEGVHELPVDAVAVGGDLHARRG